MPIRSSKWTRSNRMRRARCLTVVSVCVLLSIAYPCFLFYYHGLSYSYFYSVIASSDHFLLRLDKFSVHDVPSEDALWSSNISTPAISQCSLPVMFPHIKYLSKVNHIRACPDPNFSHVDVPAGSNRLVLNCNPSSVARYAFPSSVDTDIWQSDWIAYTAPSVDIGVAPIVICACGKWTNIHIRAIMPDERESEGETEKQVGKAAC